MLFHGCDTSGVSQFYTSVLAGIRFAVDTRKPPHNNGLIKVRVCISPAENVTGWQCRWA